MVIYDKNQFTFNLLFILILIASIMMNIILSQNFVLMNRKMLSINKTLTVIEDNQNFNFIQSPHYDLDYKLQPTGFIIGFVDDYGKFNGPSMQPVIFDGNLVIEKRYNNENLDAGQIIRYVRNDGTPVIHRVRADYGDSIYVQGDSEKKGEIIKKDQVTHIVIGVLFT